MQDKRHAKEDVAGLHLTQIQSASVTPETANLDDPAEQRVVEQGQRYQYELGAYGMLQATRPQTLAYALTDSPVGQLAWIVERVCTATGTATRAVIVRCAESEVYVR